MPSAYLICMLRIKNCVVSSAFSYCKGEKLSYFPSWIELRICQRRLQHTRQKQKRKYICFFFVVKRTREQQSTTMKWKWRYHLNCTEHSHIHKAKHIWNRIFYLIGFALMFVSILRIQSPCSPNQIFKMPIACVSPIVGINIEIFFDSKTDEREHTKLKCAMWETFTWCHTFRRSASSGTLELCSTRWHRVKLWMVKRISHRCTDNLE